MRDFQWMYNYIYTDCDKSIYASDKLKLRLAQNTLVCRVYFFPCKFYVFRMTIEWGNDYLEECTSQIQFEAIFQMFSELNGVQLRTTSNSKQFYNTESIVISNKMPTLCNSSNVEYFPKTREVPFNWPKNPLHSS